jgi:hypothetical protein
MTALIWKPLALAGFVLAGLTLAWAVLIYGPTQHRAGVQAERGRALEALAQQLSERANTDAETNRLDDAGLCAAIGGVFRDNRCE